MAGGFKELIAHDLQVGRIYVRAPARLCRQAGEQDVVHKVFVVLDFEAGVFQRLDDSFASFALGQGQQVEAIGFTGKLWNLCLEFKQKLTVKFMAQGDDEGNFVC